MRVSRVGAREGEGYISPAVQREAIEGYARELGGEIVAWHDDQDFSGGSLERPGFEAARERLSAGETDGLVVMKIDRFSRSTADGYRIVTEIIDRGQVFASCHERIDPRTPEGKFMLRSFFSNAELFLDQAKAQWWIAKSRAIARGVHIGPTPIGYRRIPSMPLEIDPVYGPAITELFRRAATGQFGDTALAHWMQERAPRGSRRWQASEVRRWLSNRVYLGEVKYGALVNVEAHEPLTDPETFAKCQRAPRAQRRASSPFLLSGLIRCAFCRYAMSGQTHGGFKGETPVYRCINSCEEASVIVAARAEEHVVGLVREHLRGLRLAASAAGVDLTALDRSASESEGEVRSFVSDLEARRIMGETAWREGLALRVADRDAKVAERDRVQRERNLSELSADLDSLSHHDLRDLLAGMIRHVFVRRRRRAPASERILVVWSDDPRAFDVPLPHRSGPFEPIRW